jgi:hypothetical protein
MLVFGIRVAGRAILSYFWQRIRVRAESTDLNMTWADGLEWRMEVARQSLHARIRSVVLTFVIVHLAHLTVT